MKRPHFKKKYVAGALAAGLAIGAGGIAAAYFGVTGSGSAIARTGHATDVTIKSVGAGYDSLIAPSTPDPYSFSQCMNTCSGITELGGGVTLNTTTSYAQLTSATVALVNFGTQKTVTVTLYLTNGPNGPYKFTETASIAAGTSTTQKVTNVTFTFATKGVFINKTFTYGISLTSSESNNVNIAIVKSQTQISIGTARGTYVSTTGITSFHLTTSSTGLAPYVPAAEFSIVGGLVGPLYPGAPATPVMYAVTNPGVTGAHLTAVKTALGTLPAGCTSTPSWFKIYGTQPHPLNETFPPGLTVVTNTGTTIGMLTSGTTQDGCQNADIPLTFTGSH